MTPQEKLNHAVLYAVREGCLFSVPTPEPDAGVRAWVQWGAMQYLHNAIREFYSDPQAQTEQP